MGLMPSIERDAPSSEKNSSPTNPVWLVEDEELLGRLFEQVLADSGFEVSWFGSAEAALEAARTSALPLLLITDVSLPGMDGLELARELRARRPELRVLVTSGFGAGGSAPPDEDVEYLHKPFTPRRLLDRLEALGYAP